MDTIEKKPNSGITLYWFTNDLRVEDNQAFFCAAASAKALLCVYVLDPAAFHPNRYGTKSIGARRWQFLYESLIDLKKTLQRQGQDLLILFESPTYAISRLINVYNVDTVIRSQNAGVYENKTWSILKDRFSSLSFDEYPSHTLFSEESLPVDLEAFPNSFSKFRKAVEPIALEPPWPSIDVLPPCPNTRAFTEHSGPVPAPKTISTPFKGGASQARKHLQNYFSQSSAARYKETRNELAGWENSTKFSPWLATGCLSVTQIIRSLKRYEVKNGRNESTYWIEFECLWREYFQWFAHVYKSQLFSFGGIKNTKPLTSYYPSRFRSWTSGTTPYPIVNACMRQLNATGYMSNRGRQIVASCFVNELDLDWRYGAAYFEEQLIDYDVAVNWGNWQYLAGVGSDPRGKRHFDLEKQTDLYDQSRAFINRWSSSDAVHAIDFVDAADWPIVSEH